MIPPGQGLEVGLEVLFLDLLYMYVYERMSSILFVIVSANNFMAMNCTVFTGL